MQEMERRYASIYVPTETMDDQFNEHCGVCDEQGIEEAVLADRDYKYDGKVIKISRKNFSKVPNDYKNSTKGKERMITYDDKAGTVSVPVEFTEEVEVKEDKDLEKIVKELEGASKMHLGQSKRIQKHLDKMENEMENESISKYVKHLNDDSKRFGESVEEEVELDEELETIYSNLQEIYENLDEDGQDDFDAILELHEEGEITDEELVEGLMDYATKTGRAKAGARRATAKTQKMQGKRDKKAADLRTRRTAKKTIGKEKAKQAAMKSKKKPGLLKKGLKKVGGALKKVFGKSEGVNESNELQAIMALDDVGIEASINKKDQVVVKKKDLKKAEAALKKSFRKGGAPELHGEEVEVEEAKLYAAKGTAYPATIDTLKMIVREKQNQTVMFKDGKAMVDLFTASAMTQVYDALKKPEIKKSFEKMILDKAGFLKAQGFAMKMISGR